MRLEHVLKTEKFDSPAHKATLNLLVTTTWVNQKSADALKPYGISIQQFNILRILRGLNPKPATVKLLTERMIDKMSNASRLVDKLKTKGLVKRTESPADRRRVDIAITQRGLETVDNASKAITAAHNAFYKKLSDEEWSIINELLDRLRTD